MANIMLLAGHARLSFRRDHDETIKQKIKSRDISFHSSLGPVNGRTP